MGQLGQAKIKNFDHTTLGDHDIGRLDVAMENAFGMGADQSLRDLDGDIDDFFQGF